MNSRRFSIGVAIAVLIIAAISAAFVVGRSSPRAAGSAKALNRPIPDLPLISENGHLTSLSAFSGSIVVMAPFLTLCSEVCPLTTSAFEAMQRDIDRAGLGARVRFVEVSVDPWRDTPARLRAFARLAHTRFPLLTGTRRQLARFWRFFGVAYWRTREPTPPDSDWLTGKPLIFDISHTDALFLLDAHGRERKVEIGMPNLHNDVPAALRRLLDAAGQRDLAHPRGGWTLPMVMGDIRNLLDRKVT